MRRSRSASTIPVSAVAPVRPGLHGPFRMQPNNYTTMGMRASYGQLPQTTHSPLPPNGGDVPSPPIGAFNGISGAPSALSNARVPPANSAPLPPDAQAPMNMFKGTYSTRASIGLTPDGRPVTPGLPPTDSHRRVQDPMYRPPGPGYPQGPNGIGAKGMSAYHGPVTPLMLGNMMNTQWRGPFSSVPTTASDRHGKSESHDSESLRENGYREGPARTAATGASQPSGRSGLSERDENFVVDISCLGERKVQEEGRRSSINGFIRMDSRLNETDYVKLGSRHHALLISCKGFTYGQRYWEFQDCIVNEDTTEPLTFRVGVLPRSITQAVDINNTMEHNGGVSASVTHGPGEGEFQYGDRIGVYMDCNHEGATLRFFKNGKFFSKGGLTIHCITMDRLLYPAIGLHGQESAHCAFCIVPGAGVPNLVEHARQEEAYLEARREEMRLKKLRQPKVSDERRRKISLAHHGATVEISSGLHEDLMIRQGDALLFVEQHCDEKCEWYFESSDDKVLAQDTFYLHQEYDLHSPNTHNVLKVAYKFVAMSLGVTEFRSVYSETEGSRWKQNIRITVTP